MRFEKWEADAIYALTQWMDGYEAGDNGHHGRIPAHFELTMAYRSGLIGKKKTLS